MNDTERAQLCAEYNRISTRLAEISEQLERDARSRKSTYVMSGVKVKYSAGRVSYDHEACARSHDVPDELVEKHTTVKRTTAWARVTGEMGLDHRELVRYQKPGSAASVKFEIVEAYAESVEEGVADLELADAVTAAQLGDEYVPEF